MEVLLPVALKVFPNMLPSTFEDKLKVRPATATVAPCGVLTNLNNFRPSSLYVGMQKTQAPYLPCTNIYIADA